MTYLDVVRKVAAAKQAEKERRDELERNTPDNYMSPIAPLSPRAREALRNLGILD